ncbi:MAG TPA: hypothetical protein VFH15_04405 [Pyrinomonadaceae bacterium]|nr:hypothetical protein [Pyrinomonadaceae bacterium]
MSKQIVRGVQALCCCLIVASLLVGTSVGFAPQGGAIAARTSRNAAIVAATTTILEQTSEIRELPILRPVKSGAQSRAEIERMIIKNQREQTTPAEMHATELVLKKLGLVPVDFQYAPFIVKLLTEQVAGYYDPRVQRFYLADWIELEGQKPVMAHELAHALQDQHFNLRRFEKWPKGDSDAELAVHSLIEGDATLAMTLYMAKNPLVALAFVRSISATNTTSEQFKQAPRALRETLLFPYEQGSEWASRMYKRGGWTLVSSSFTKLPLSTEQILHPEKYLSYEAPVKIDLPDLHGVLGPGWKKIDADVNGEWSFYLILDQFLNSPAESKRAAAGWAGDRYALYLGPKADEALLVQRTTWDTEADAREFFDAYSKRTARRYPKAGDANKAAVDPQHESASWKTSEGEVVVELRGNDVLIIEGLPTKADKDAVRNSLWAQNSTKAN